MKNFHIKQVTTKKDLNKFIRFPWKVYQGDDNWVPPLILDVKEKLNKKKYPFFEHGDMDIFLAYKNDEITGRIAAIIDDNHNACFKEKVVFFGMYESINDLETAKGLLDRAAEWGRERGMELLRGPVNLSMNDECVGFLLEGFDSPPVIMMAYNPAYYIELMEKCGLAKAKDLLAFYMTRNHKEKDKVQMIVEKTKQETKIKIRKIDLKNIKQETDKFRHIYNNAWSENWGFVPWTENEMYYTAKKLKQMADPAIVLIAEDEGRPVGCVLGLPNYNEILPRLNGRLYPFGIFKLLYYRNRIKGVRNAIFGVHKDYWRTGLSYLLYSEFEKNLIARGYEWCESSWQLEDNEAVNRLAISIGGSVYKKYRLYNKNIA